MRILILLSLIILIQYSANSQSKSQYLKKNRFNIEHEMPFPQTDFKVVGFGALHGSQKTEKAEIRLLNSLMKNNELSCYIMETDYSIGYYFDNFLTTGDTLLLKDLVSHYGLRVPQEKSIETYKKWIELYKINKELQADKKLKVYGIDPIVSYKYTFKHIIDLIGEAENLKVLSKIRAQVKLDTTDFSPYYESFSKLILKEFVREIETDNLTFKHPELDQLLVNLKISFGDYKREKVIFDNYKWLVEMFDLKEKKQFIRYGVFHIEKEREYENFPSFFTRLIEHNIYDRNEIIAVVGYLTKSEVLWDLKFDDNGNYLGYTVKAGFGIIDYWKEYFRGIRKLKKSKLSDLTLYRLNQPLSPYNKPKPDLIEIKMLFSKSNKAGVKGKATTRFIDYAILISNSDASQPIEALK